MKFKIDKDTEEKIVNFGAFGYDIQKMANVLDWSPDEIRTALDEKKLFWKLYQKGKDTADYVIDLKLFEMAQSGDLKALEEFESRKEMRND